MKIGIVATHSFPIPHSTHTGDTVIRELAESLHRLGHEVTLYAPDAPGLEGVTLAKMPLASYGNASPGAEECEQACWNTYSGRIASEDIIHDFSIGKTFAEGRHAAGRPHITTLLGGQWERPRHGENIVVWCRQMRMRGLRGQTDYAGTANPEMGGPAQRPIKDAHVVYGGIDTDFYYPHYDKKPFVLWMNRWHPAKGYRQAIALARETGCEMVMAGEHPDNEMFEYQRNCAIEATQLAKGLPNVHFEFLPKDPEHHIAKRALYQRARALIYSVQFQEPFGLSQAEAMACATPVIGTNFGSVMEVVDQGVGGYVVGNETKHFAKALELLPQISLVHVRERAVCLFDRMVMAKNYVHEYSNVINGMGWGA